MLFFSPCHLGSRIILEWYVYTCLLFAVVAPSEEVKLDPEFELPGDMEVAVRDNNNQDNDMPGKQCSLSQLRHGANQQFKCPSCQVYLYYSTGEPVTIRKLCVCDCLLVCWGTPE